MSDMSDAARRLSESLRAGYEALCKADPGLRNAVERAQRTAPEIGWVDVAAARGSGMPRREIDPDARRELDMTHAGFTIRCGQCGSEAVGVDSDVGGSPESGIWGGVYLRCAGCGLKALLWGEQ